MPTGYPFDEQDGLYYLTLQAVEWVDILESLPVIDTFRLQIRPEASPNQA